MRKTLVLQSYRQVDVPDWIKMCMQTVVRWAGIHSYDYLCHGDELFDLVPEWFRAKAGQYVTVLSDLARLELIALYLDRGFSRVIWCDADIVVVDPERFVLASELAFAFSREIWTGIDPSGNLVCSRRVNNAICFFQPDSRQVLQDLITLSKRMVARKRQVDSKLLIGTPLLTAIDRQYPMPLLRDTCMISPAIVRAIVDEDRTILSQFRHAHQQPLYAFNLCHSFRGSRVTDEELETAARLLITTDGKLLNDA